MINTLAGTRCPNALRAIGTQYAQLARHTHSVRDRTLLEEIAAEYLSLAEKQEKAA